MRTIAYYKALFMSKITRKGNAYIVNKFRLEGMEIGHGTHIFSNIASGEPYLVAIGNNCTISSEVIFLTHDASIGLFGKRKCFSDICGRITIGDNCFIGNRSIVLYGVSIPNNTIVAAGSIVTKSFIESGTIIGGNPAKVIGKVDDFLKKNEKYFLSLDGLSEIEKKQAILSSGKLIQK